MLHKPLGIIRNESHFSYGSEVGKYSKDLMIRAVRIIGVNKVEKSGTESRMGNVWGKCGK